LQIGSCKSGCFQLDRSEIILGEIDPLEISSCEIGPMEVGFLVAAPIVCDSSQPSPLEVRSTEVGFAEVRSTEVGFVEVRSTEVGFAEVRSTDVCLAEISSFQVGFVKECAAEVRSFQVEQLETSLVEIDSLEMRLDVWMLLSPGIPHDRALPEHFKLFLKCHRHISTRSCYLSYITRWQQGLVVLCMWYDAMLGKPLSTRWHSHRALWSTLVSGLIVCPGTGSKAMPWTSGVMSRCASRGMHVSLL
jgi:hypothetical protein